MMNRSPAQPIRFIALDYDGTLAIDGAFPSARVRAAIQAAQARGAHVTLATGRGFRSASGYAAALGLVDPLVCFQGGLIRALTGEQPVLYAESLPHHVLGEALAFAAAAELDLGLYASDSVFIVAQRREQAFYDRWFGVPIRRVAHFDEALAQIAAEGDAPVKCLCIGTREESDRTEAALRAQFAPRLAVVRSHEFFVELIPPVVSKGAAVAFLAERFGIDRAAVLAIGDSGNDVSMVQWAGVGVAMGNATADVRAVADWCAPPVAEDGAAVAIERFVLAGP